MLVLCNISEDWLRVFFDISMFYEFWININLSCLVLKLSYPILGQRFFSVPQLQHQETSAFLTLSVGIEREHWHEMGYIST